MKKLSTAGYGVIFTFGFIVQTIASSAWQNYSNIMICEGYSAGDMIYALGEDIFDICCVLCISKLFNNHKLFLYLSTFAAGVIIMDMIHIVFLNPMQVSLSKFVGYGFALFYTLFRLRKINIDG